MPNPSPSDAEALETLGRRLARRRLNENLTQAALAEQAGVSTPTVQRIEHGHSSQSSNLIRILRALGLLANLDALVPDVAASPMQQIKMRGRPRRRASSSDSTDEAAPWSWEDDQ
jgi:transcriptional regulator with XRE-family HTH domain